MVLWTSQSRGIAYSHAQDPNIPQFIDAESMHKTDRREDRSRSAADPEEYDPSQNSEVRAQISSDIVLYADKKQAV